MYRMRCNLLPNAKAGYLNSMGSALNNRDGQSPSKLSHGPGDHDGGDSSQNHPNLHDHLLMLVADPLCLINHKMNSPMQRAWRFALV
ncbi:hypothetical protein HJFPF1_03718 [Paramyrothecium foliicola]|nr:hypothetical protein HJFPF1_03718 [Paramyrothecium foliicola]